MGGVQTYRGHPNIWWCPNIQGASKHMGVSKHTREASKPTGGHPDIKGAFPHAFLLCYFCNYCPFGTHSCSITFMSFSFEVDDMQISNCTNICLRGMYIPYLINIVKILHFPISFLFNEICPFIIGDI